MTLPFNSVLANLDIPIKWKNNEEDIVVVQMGDIFDRGIYDIELFILFQILKIKAQKLNHKKLIMVVGNHELINLDSGYVDVHLGNPPKVVSIPRREKYLPVNGRHAHEQTKYGAETLKIKFKSIQNSLNPGGKLAKLFSENSPIEIHNGILFTHGGLSPDFIKMDLGGDFYGNYQWYINLYKTFTGLNSLPDELPPWLKNKYGKKNKKRSRKILRENIIFDKEYFSSRSSRQRPAGIGPTWYRGYNHDIKIKESDIEMKKLEETNVEKCLKLAGTIKQINESKKNSITEDVNIMVVGHSSVNKIKSFCDKKIFYTETGAWTLVHRVPQILKLDVIHDKRAKKIEESVLSFQFVGSDN